MINDDRIELEGIMWYQAPSVAEVSPNQIQEGHHLIELIVGGVVYFEAGETVEAVHHGGVFWHIPGDYTISRTEPDNPYECIVFSFRCADASTRKFPRLSYWRNRDDACEFARKMLGAYYDETSDRDILSNYAYSRLAWNAHRATIKKAPAVPKQLLPLIEAVDRDPSVDLSIEQMSKICDISVPHLHALFKEHLGTTPHQYLLVRRLRRARHLIVSSDDPIKQISDECGFRNIETFYRSFKKRFSVSPGEFRRANRPY